MNFIPVREYDSYIEAHIVVGRLANEDIICHLKDEHSVTLSPFLSSALGGIKLMVAESQAERAIELLKQFDAEGND